MAGGAARVPVIGMLTEYECSSASPHTTDAKERFGALSNDYGKDGKRS